jgi:two-component system sensor histidine kinase YesM
MSQLTLLQEFMELITVKKAINILPSLKEKMTGEKRIGKMTRRTGRLLRNRIIITYLFIIGIMLLTVWLYSYMNTQIRKKYEVLVERNMMLVELPIAITNTKQYFNQYLRDYTNDSLSSYFKYNQQISDILSRLRRQFSPDQKSMTYIRVLTTMHAYQSKTIKEMVGRNKLTFQEYQEISFLKMVFNSMNVEAQQFILTGLKNNENEYASFLEKAKRKEQIINLIIMIAVIGSVFGVILMTNGAFLTLNRLYNAARLLSEGHWEIGDLKSGRYQELNAVALAFNNMKHDIRKYFKQAEEKSQVELRLQHEKLLNIKKSQLLQEMQLKSLQQQMNPHFLFNTLNMIGKTATLQDTEVTLELIEAISKILRYNLEHEGSMTDLQAEVEVTKAYLFIQQTRFQEQMTFKLEDDAEFGNVKVPPLILQPLVENAIIHGMADKKRNGCITITFNAEAGFLNIAIADNGCGFNPVEIKDSTAIKNRIGLANIRQRLRLHYQRDDLLRIESEINRGTIVTIKIPLEDHLEGD